MKTQLELKLPGLCLLAWGLCLPAFAQPTLMTYQGRLFDAGNPANGNYDFTFAFYNLPTGGSPLFGPVTNSNVAVSNGLFTTFINVTGINPSLFSGGVVGAHFLEVDARPNGSTGGFSALIPRQPLGTTPEALTAATANGVATNAVTAAGIAPGQVVKSLNGLEDTVTLAAGANVTITPSGNTLTIASTGGGGGGWSLTGNSGTTPGPDFVGTSDNQPLELHVNGQRALRLEPNPGGFVNFLGGSGNFSSNAFSATISGGAGNIVTNNYGTVAGGYANLSGGQGAAVGGGAYNMANGATSGYATVGGGQHNAATNDWATVGGGVANNASGQYATVGGGWANSASDNATAVAGGALNIASAQYASVGGGYNNSASNYSAVIGGGSRNISSGQVATVGGGYGNAATNDSATVGGGNSNVSGGKNTTVGGGEQNIASGASATVSGGDANKASGQSATVGGGSENTAANDYASLGGGALNRAAGNAATVSGGYGNAAVGNGSFVGGGGYDGTTYSRNVASGPVTVVSGGLGNSTWAYAATIGGGTSNNAYGPACVVGGGEFNTADGGAAGGATVSGGTRNFATGAYSAVAGGNNNLAYADYASVGGGDSNFASGPDGTVSGGKDNSAKGKYSTVPGGQNNVATGDYSFAAGYGALAVDPGSFVWSDGTSIGASQGQNTFTAYASGGVTFLTTNFVEFYDGGNNSVYWSPGAATWSIISDRNAKDRIEAAEPQTVLEKLSRLQIYHWSYKGYPQRHLGPMAQDFHALFPFNGDERSINELDLSGVALAAIQGLNQKLESELKRRDAENAELKHKNDSLEHRLETLEQMMLKQDHLKEHNHEH